MGFQAGVIPVSRHPGPEHTGPCHAAALDITVCGSPARAELRAAVWRAATPDGHVHVGTNQLSAI